MSSVPDISGRRYGRLFVIAKARRQRGHQFYRCRCDCGTRVTVRGWDLRRAFTVSCGCFWRELIAQRSAPRGPDGRFRSRDPRHQLSTPPGKPAGAKPVQPTKE